MPADRVETDMMTYSAAVTALAKASRLEEAFRLMREMSEERGLAPTSAAYEGIIETYGRRDRARAEELIAFVRGGGGGGGMGKPDFFAYSVGIAVCAAAAATTARYIRGAPTIAGRSTHATAKIRIIVPFVRCRKNNKTTLRDKQGNHLAENSCCFFLSTKRERFTMSNLRKRRRSRGGGRCIHGNPPCPPQASSSNEKNGIPHSSLLINIYSSICFSLIHIPLTAV